MNTTTAQATACQLATPEPWTFLGVSKAAWHRLRSAGLTPLPINLLPGRPLWRIADLESWLAKQPSFKGRSKRGGNHRQRAEDKRAEAD